MDYAHFIENLDKRLDGYFREHKDYICCSVGCSACCEKGDYPISQAELEFLMQGYISLENETKLRVQENLKTIERGGKCPFLIDKKCSVYYYRPIICRVHGLAYLCKENTVKLPYCVELGKNYHTVYQNGKFLVEPIMQELDTNRLLEGYDCGEFRNLYDWIRTV